MAKVKIFFGLIAIYLAPFPPCFKKKIFLFLSATIRLGGHEWQHGGRERELSPDFNLII